MARVFTQLPLILLRHIWYIKGIKWMHIERKKKKVTWNKIQGRGQNSSKRFFWQTYSSKFLSRTLLSSSGGNQKKKQKCLFDDRNCYIHVTAHNWGQHHQNQYGEKFRPHCKTTSASNYSNDTNVAPLTIGSKYNHQIFHPPDLQKPRLTSSQI